MKAKQDKKARKRGRLRLKTKLAIASAAFSLLGGTMQRGRADTYVWIATANSSWPVAKNWFDVNSGKSAAPPTSGASTAVIFTDNITYNGTGYTFAGVAPGGSGTYSPGNAKFADTGQTFDIGSIAFGDSATGLGALQLGSALTIDPNATPTGSTTIELSGGTGLYSQAAVANSGTLNLAASTKTQTIDANIQVDPALSTQTWALNGSNILALNGTISLAAGQTLIQSGSAEVDFNVDNSSSLNGAYQLQGGTVIVGNNTALGPAGNVISVGGSKNTSLLIKTGITNFSNPVQTVYSPGSTITLGGNTGTNTWAGAITIGSGATSQGIILWGGTGASGLTTISGLIQDSNPSNAANDPISKNDPGTVIITNPSNTFAGALSVQAGTLVAGANGTPLGTGASDIQVTNALSAHTASLLTEGGITFNRNVTVNGNLNGSGTLLGAILGQYSVNPASTTWNGNITLNQATTLTGGGGTVLFAGTIQDGTTSFNNSNITVGTGTVILSGTNTYSGSTTISGGTLQLGPTGSIPNSSTIDVQSGAILDLSQITSHAFTVGSSQTLQGNGTVAGSGTTTTINGKLLPGEGDNSEGEITVAGNLALVSTSITHSDLAGASAGVAGGYDQVSVGGNLTYGGTLTVNLIGSVAWGDYYIFSVSGGPTTISGDFANIQISGSDSVVLSDSGGVWTGTSASGNVYTFTDSTGDLNVVAAPEPASLGLFGLAGTVLVRRRRTCISGI